MQEEFLVEEMESIIAPTWYDPSSWSTAVKVAVVVGTIGLVFAT